MLKSFVKLLITNKLLYFLVSGIKDSFSPLGVIAKNASSQITSLYFFNIISKDSLSHN